MTKFDLDALELKTLAASAIDKPLAALRIEVIRDLIAELRAARAVVDVARVAFGLRNVPGYAGDSMLDVGDRLDAYDATVQP